MAVVGHGLVMTSSSTAIRWIRDPMSNRATKQLIRGLLTGQTQSSIQYGPTSITPARKSREKAKATMPEAEPFHRHEGNTTFSCSFTKLCVLASLLFPGIQSEHHRQSRDVAKPKAGGVKRALEEPEVDRSEPIIAETTSVEAVPETVIISRPLTNAVSFTDAQLAGVPSLSDAVPVPKPFDEAQSCLGAAWERNGGCFSPVLDSRSVMTHAKCGLCGKLYVHSTISGTSNMNRHWLQAHNGKATLLHKNVKTSQLSPAHQWHNDRVMAALIVLDGGPISRTRNPSFIWGMSELVGSWVVPSPGHLNSHHFLPMLERFHVPITEDLVKSCHFTLCFDAWKAKKGVKSGRNRTFLGVSLFAVDRQWNLRKYTIAVHRMIGTKDRDAIVKRIQATMTTVMLPRLKVVNLVSDNAFAEVAAATQLVEDDGIYHHSRCFNHTLSLALKDGFKSTVTESNPVETKFAPSMLDVVHSIVMLFADHGKLSDQLELQQRTQKIAVPVCLMADVETRWTSVYGMFYRVFRLTNTIRTVLVTAKLTKYQEKVDQALLSLVKVQNDLPFIMTVLWYCKTASDVMEEAGSFLGSLLYVVSDLERKLKVSWSLLLCREV
jgi:hypothetical protein